MLTRRDTLLGAAALGACAPLEQHSAYTPPPNDSRFAAIEQRIGGRVGVAAWNTGTGEWMGRRIQERFAMCSTFKWMLAAQMLFYDMHQPDHLLQRVPFTESDLLDYAPVARQHLARGWMSVVEAAEGAVVISDNTCANLLLRVGDGPQGLTHFLAVYGDTITRLDRTEPRSMRIFQTTHATPLRLKRWLVPCSVSC
ncbi:MAG: serine hydrolase [Alphaproteobacteria bacterium]|nr:serine hydrolase [Alphaproteobacteria bacterium]